MGYGTEEHMQALATVGLSPVHRRSFCKRFLG
jgi:ribonuclease HII